MFRPIDAFCVHVDVKAPESVHRAVEAVLACYRHRFPESTVFQSGFPVPILWGDSGTITADTNCFR